jgi:hypothetical protein
MIEALKDLFDPKKMGFFVKGIEIKDWGNRVVINFIQSHDSPQNGSDLIVQFKDCYKIHWEFYGDEGSLTDTIADVIGINIYPGIELVVHCDLFEIIIHFRDFEVLST